MKTGGAAPPVLTSELEAELISKKIESFNSLYFTHTHTHTRARARAFSLSVSHTDAQTAARGGCEEIFAAVKVRHSVQCRNTEQNYTNNS
jgi:hypothetical protein